MFNKYGFVALLEIFWFVENKSVAYGSLIASKNDSSIEEYAYLL